MRLRTCVVLLLVALAAPAAPAIVTVGGVETIRGAVDVAVSGDLAYLAAIDLLVFDVSNPENPFEVASLEGLFALRLERRGALLFVAGGGDGFWIADLANPRQPVTVGHLPTLDNSVAVALVGDFAYVAEERGGLRIVDVSDPTDPVEAGRFDTGGEVVDVVADGTTLYLANRYRGLRILDVSDPRAPVEIGFLVQSTIRTVTLERGVVAIGTTSGSGPVLHLVDVSDPRSPTRISEIPASRAVRQGDRLYTTLESGFRVFDVSDLSTPVLLASFGTRGFAYSIDVVDNLAYVATAHPSGLRIIDLTRLDRPAQVGAFPIFRFRKDIAVDEPFAYVVDGVDLEAFDVSDPTAAISLGRMRLFADDVELVDGLLYVVDDLLGLRILDIGDPSDPIVIGELKFVGPVPTDVEVDDGFAYVSDRQKSLLVIDISDPTNPFEVASIATSDQAMGVEVADGIAYVSNWFSGLLVVDVGDPLAPITIASLVFPFAGVLDVEVEGTLAYVGFTNGFLRIFDVSDPANPVPLAVTSFGQGARIDDIVVRDGMVFLAGPGVRVVDATDPTVPFELGAITLGAQSVVVVGPRVYTPSHIFEFGDEYLPGLDVVIDIRPFDESNRVNPGRPGLLPVAVLGSDALHAREIDRSSVRFGPDGAVALRFARRFDLHGDRVRFGPAGAAAPHSAPRLGVNGDRVRDRTFFFRNRQTGIAVGDTEACLRGRSRQGRRFSGCDTIQVEGCGPGFGGAAFVLPILGLCGRLRRRRV